MKPLPRGLVVSVGASVAFHVAAVAMPWRGVQAGASRPPAAATLSARLIESPPAALPVEDRPVPAAETAVPAAAVPTIMTEVATAPPAAVSPPAPAPVAELPSRPAPVAAPALPESVTPLPSDPLSTVRGPAESPIAGLDRGPRPLDAIDPAFPAAAGARGGTVTLRLVISDMGEVESIAVVHAVPPGLFDEAALAAFGRARFAPGLRGGIAVRSEVMYEVEFAPLGKGTESSGRTY